MLAHAYGLRCTGTAEAVAILGPLVHDPEREVLACVAIDRKGRAIEAAQLTIGNDGATIVDPRQILRWALTRTHPAISFILAHNHPSGDPTPSREDIEITKRVVQAAKAIGLRCCDHIVFGWDSKGEHFVSLAEIGELPDSYATGPGYLQ